MIYAYRCPSCQKREDRDVPMVARNDQHCVCGEWLHRVYSTAVIIPLHMKATGDDIARQVMPQGEEHADGGKEARKAWLTAAHEQNVTPRYRHDLEG